MLSKKLLVRISVTVEGEPTGVGVLLSIKIYASPRHRVLIGQLGIERPFYDKSEIINDNFINRKQMLSP